MTWTYSGNPGLSAKDATRFYIGDTDQRNQLLQDGEIEYVLNIYNNTPINAAIRCCEMIMAKVTRLVDESVGQVKLSYSQRVKAFRDLRNDLVNRLATEDATPFAGGISIAQVMATNQNADRVRPSFTDHMMQNNLTSPWILGGECYFWLYSGPG